VKIRYLRVARRELDTQIDYLLERNPRAADALDRAITQALEDLAAGRLEGSEHRLRASGRRVQRWYVEPLMLYYQRRPTELVVLRVRHHAQRPITVASP
jgi:plasmid stabilization system protein ParE